MDVSELTNKKILYVITKANWGGAQRYVFDLAIYARSKGYDVSVAYGTPGALSERLEAESIRTHHILSMGRDIKLGSDIQAYKELLTLFKAEQPEVVHVNSSKAGIVGALAARSAKIPHIIFTAHGWAFNEARPLLQKIIFKGIYALIIYLCTRTICVSRAVFRDMSWLPAIQEKSTIIHNGADRIALQSRIEARSALTNADKGGRWIGITAELHPTKRIEDAIDALAILLPSNPDLRLVVLGEGQNRAALEFKCKERGLTEHVTLAGFVPDAPSYLSAFDIFVLCSRTEGLAYALLEAGAAVLPVVATRVGGIPEIIEDGKTGLLIPALQPKELAAALKKLLDDPEYATQLGHTLSERVAADFSKERMCSKTLAVYSS
ncbi:MAG: Glycosyl transferase, group 1 family protein [Parcubacteria bacterium C7867-008]|nr:MAG: Glycosyl transferase, group 1 family protein [Parcubacteria bacterium C7867-008]